MSNRSSTMDFKEQEVFEVLSHEIRRKIIRLLAQHSFLAYSDLKKELKLSTGVLYHHLQKLQQMKLVSQRKTKEYELTDQGYQLLEYLRTLESDDFLSMKFTTQVPGVVVFLKDLPIAKIVTWNPLAVALGSMLMLLIGIGVQLNFDLMFIGPYLIPTDEEALIKLVLELFTMLIGYAILEAAYHAVHGRQDWKKEGTFLSGLTLLPATSSLGMLILWVISLLIPILPEIIYWMIISALHVTYFLILFNLLMNIKKISAEKTIILVLLTFYVFLLLVHLMM